MAGRRRSWFAARFPGLPANESTRTKPRARGTKLVDAISMNYEWKEGLSAGPLYFALAGGTIPFMRRYSTICP